MTAPPPEKLQVVDQPWSLGAEAVARGLETDPARGLSNAEVAARQGAFGANELVETHRRSAWRLFAEQFANTMILVLAAAAVITAVVGDAADAVVIGAIVLLNGVVGFVQEHRAEEAMAALRRLTAEAAHVRRDGALCLVPAAGLVPGDVVVLAAGDVVPADLRLADAQALSIDEAALTGESEAVGKIVESLPGADGSLLGERRNMAFRGTAVTHGRGAGIVVSIGMATELGRIAALLQTPASATPLQRRLAGLARWLAGAALVVCGVVFAVGVARGEPVDRMFLTAVSLAVAAIPEGLPAVVTVALALGARRMVDRHALVRKLPAVETLGSVSVICSDKTGTLTENRMLVERVWTPNGEYDVSGSGYEPDGRFLGATDPGGDPYLMSLARVAAACNDAVLHSPERPGDGWGLTGDPTEGALLALAGKRGVDRPALERQRPRCVEVAFDASRRRMSTATATGSPPRAASTRSPPWSPPRIWRW
jgi:Ca2+-transporting ATPase